MRAVYLSMLKIALISLLLQLAVAHQVNAQHFQLDGNKKTGRMNFTLIRNLVIIPLFINEKGPFNFILDTGVGPMVITDHSIIKDLNLKNLRPIKINGLGKGLEIDALLCNELSARIGTASIANIPAAILQNDIFGLSSYVGTKIYGLIGYSFFSSFTVELKYSSKRLVFHVPKSKTKFKGERIPIQLINSKPYVHITIQTPELGEVSTKMVVDNGASHAVSMETFNEKPFPVPATSISANLGIGLSGPISGRIGRIPKILIGRHELKNVVASYPIYEDAASKTLLLNRNGNLGADILSRFNVTFDYLNDAMYLQKNYMFKRPFEHDMSGLEIYLEDSDPKRFFISRIEQGSPGEIAGLMINDEILEINFQKSKTLSLNDVNKIFSSYDGRPIILSINRNGEQVIKIIKLKKRI